MGKRSDRLRTARELHALDSADTLRSIGFPFAGIRVRIVDDDDDGYDVAAGEPGEVVVQSDSLFRSYWDDAATTIATVRDGWCHTGDIGRFDDRGLLYLIDRKKDVIITGGENVYSPEVEGAVSGAPGVSACAVVGAPDERWGETVCAVVVPRAGATLTLDEVQAFVRQRLARYKVPQHRVIVVGGAPSLAWNRDDALQDDLVRKAFRRNVTRPVHFVPTAEGFGAAVRAGLGWGMYPEQLAAPMVRDGSFVRIADVHLDVPLFWQCWKLDSPIVGRITEAVRSGAAQLRQRKS
jgi:acyl-CoA synthetase (AMP-forming)/AMP-acid ligase II